jgi:hypothetical protein
MPNSLAIIFRIFNRGRIISTIYIRIIECCKVAALTQFLRDYITEWIRATIIYSEVVTNLMNRMLQLLNEELMEATELVTAQAMMDLVELCDEGW